MIFSSWCGTSIPTIAELELARLLVMAPRILPGAATIDKLCRTGILR
jgi:hypothetical protein